MNKKPIGPTAHGAIDYAFGTMHVLAPSLFGLKGTARTLCYAFAAVAGVITVLTDYPLGLKRVIPFRMHGQLEIPYIPALLLLPWALGALKEANARRFFLGSFGFALANFLLTDYNAYESEDAPLTKPADGE